MASYGEAFNCVREAGNIFDLFAVAIVRDGEIIVHMPRLISAACSLFLRHSSSIKCKVTGSRQYSRDLPQGGLEISCTLTFEGDKVFIEKVKKLTKLTELDLDTNSQTQLIGAASVPSAANTSSTVDDGFSVTVLVDEGEDIDNGSTYKKRKLDHEDNVWIKIDRVVLRVSDKAVLLSRKLDDKIIGCCSKASP